MVAIKQAIIGLSRLQRQTFSYLASTMYIITFVI